MCPCLSGVESNHFDLNFCSHGFREPLWRCWIHFLLLYLFIYPEVILITLLCWTSRLSQLIFAMSLHLVSLISLKQSISSFQFVIFFLGSILTSFNFPSILLSYIADRSLSQVYITSVFEVFSAFWLYYF